MKHTYTFRAQVILILTLIFVGKVGAQEKTPPPRPDYKPLRYDEDWSSLSDEANRKESLDRLKYISLRRENWYVTLGGEARPFYEFIRNENWGGAPRDDNGWLSQRYMMHADFHLGKRARVFAQLKSGLINHRNGGARATDLDKMDFHQLFFDYKFFNRKNGALLLRMGRQEITFGSARLVAVRENPNVRLSFDGVRLAAKLRQWTLDAFVAEPESVDTGYFDDKPLHQQSFGGVYAVSPAGFLTKKGKIDLYYFRLDRKTTRFNQGTGREIRHTTGARIWNNSAPPFDYNLEFAYQFGQFGSGDIDAWMAASDIGYTVKKWRFKPRFGLKADATSGDKSPGNQNLQTFNSLFPRGGYFSQFAPVGPYNQMDLHPALSLFLSTKVSLNLDWLNYWRTSLKDGVYNVAGSFVRSGNQSRARFIGAQYALEFRWQLNRHTTLTANTSRFNVGQFLRETPPAKNINYFAAWLTYKF